MRQRLVAATIRDLMDIPPDPPPDTGEPYVPGEPGTEPVEMPPDPPPDTGEPYVPGEPGTEPVEIPPDPPPPSGEPFVPGEPGTEPVEMPPADPTSSSTSGPSTSRIRYTIAALGMLFAITTFLLIQLLHVNSNSAQPNVGAGQVHIVVDATDSDGRKTTFESTVRLTRDQIGGIDDQTLSGSGTGPFQQEFVSDQCGFIITWSGQVDVDVVARLSDSRVEVTIGGPVKEAGTWPGAECLDGTYYSPNRGATELDCSCDFKNVDFTHAGIYRGPPPEEAPNPYGCTLEFTPS